MALSKEKLITWLGFLIDVSLVAMGASVGIALFILLTGWKPGVVIEAVIGIIVACTAPAAAIISWLLYRKERDRVLPQVKSWLIEIEEKLKRDSDKEEDTFQR